ncbi:hypothetical protein [Edaphobacter sp. 12200R-103]|jgi:hypothetical protein|uniref:hypothetical protein n=1 Tax=Edaphobacter sp. 12200R-103 TaxID=2703788 RepID=UPI00192EFF48|nr:hypothetical protein [Edaphobacter sp. 12200R-103]
MATTTGKAGLNESVRSALENGRVYATRLNLYYASIGLLVLVNLYLLVHIAFAWSMASSQNPAAIEQQTVALKAAEIATKPLEGLDQKLVAATRDADTFYDKRLPTSYSEVLAELGALTNERGVKLTRAQYAPSPVLSGSSGALTEIRMDASLNGDYRPLVLFINSLERDKMFFLIRGVTLTGQQSGTVGLRLALTTYLRPANGAATASAPAESATKDGGKSQ